MLTPSLPEDKPAIRWNKAGLIGIAAILVYFYFFPQHQLLDWQSFLTWTGMVALPLLPAVWVLVEMWVPGQGMLQQISSVLIYALAGAAGLLYAVNLIFDASPVVAHSVAVTGQRSSIGRHSSVHYYLMVQDWRGGSAPLRLSVDSAFYSRHHYGQRIEVRTRHGALGFDYVESYQ